MFCERTSTPLTNTRRCVQLVKQGSTSLMLRISTNSWYHRILYYVLVAAVVLIRKHGWIAAGAAPYIMTYAGAAAIHAIILWAIHASSTSLLSDGELELGQGASAWIRRLVLDLDTDATLAIVGVGFLMLLPLAVYSTTFQKSEAKTILAAWGILMLIGAICCLITLYTVDTTADGPFNQYRICKARDHSPLSTPNTYPPLGSDWNATIHGYISEDSTSSHLCFYPCLYSSQILRSQSDITIVPFPDVQPGSRRYWTFKILSACLYACIPLYITGGIVLLLHRRFLDQNSNNLSTFRSMKVRFDSLRSSPVTVKVAVKFVFVSFQIFALVFAAVVIVVVVVFAE
jgi:hypothetical protein